MCLSYIGNGRQVFENLIFALKFFFLSFLDYHRLPRPAEKPKVHLQHPFELENIIEDDKHVLALPRRMRVAGKRSQRFLSVGHSSDKRMEW